MKKLALLSTFCILLVTIIVKAQIPPNAFNYSAVARNAAGQPISTTTIGIQFSILKTSPTGSTQYIENHFVNTDAFGLFNLVIGAGAVQSGSLATIDWSNDNYYLKVGMDANGGTNFLVMGTTQLLSVPYALYAKSAGSVSSGGTSGFTHYIGEEFGGGVIFHLWKDAQGVEHGLIVDRINLSNAQSWSNIGQSLIGATAQSIWDGLSNSNAIVGQAGHSNSAAALCLNSTNGGQSDWYLPSIHELNLLWNNYYTVNRSLSQISGATQLHQVYYWSSTERDNSNAHSFYFGYLFTHIYPGKAGSAYVRAVRAF
jgi:hypothetical protein